MKFLALIFLLMFSLSVNAQRVIGVVLDRNTHELIPHAAVKSGSTIQVTDINGNFFLSDAKPTDTVRVTYIGYQVYYGLVGRHAKDTLKVYLSPIANVLRDVNIRGDRNRKLDSIQNRREFASAFNYKTPTFYDAFNEVNPYEEYHPFNDLERTNTTAQIVNVNMLAVLGLIGKTKTPDSKLHDLVIKDEKLNYVDERFSKKRVQTITKLQSDALADFIYLYRPSIGALKQMSDYDLDVYIKKSYSEYKAGKNPDKRPVVK
jgi:hypothetical protein